MLIWQRFAFIMAAMVSTEIAAAAPEALLEHDFSLINDGKPYELLLPINQKTFVWRSPFSAQAELVIRFPYRDGAEITAISAQALYESPGKVKLEKLDEAGQWVEIASGKAMNFNFTTPVKTRALRAIMSDISNRDHDILQYNNFKITGTGLGPVLKNKGMLSLRCDAADNVFDISASDGTVHLPEIQAVIANVDSEPRQFTVKGEFRHYAGGTAETVAPATLMLQPGQTAGYTLTMKGKTPGPYFGVVTVYDGEMPRASQALIIGLRDPEIFAGKRAPDKFVSPGALRGDAIPEWRNLLREKGALWASDISHCIGGSHTPDENYFAKVSGDGAELAMAISSYHDFEPLPGVYNLEWVDRMVSMAGKNHMGLEFGLWHWDFNGPSQFWLKSELRRDLQGKTSVGWQGIPSLFSEKFTLHAQRAAAVLAQRYAACPEIWVWSLHPYGVVDHDNTDIYDTFPAALTAFHKMLETKYKTIGELNRHYQSNYSSFAVVPVPESLADQLSRAGKYADAATVVDQRLEWLDWLSFYHQRTVWFRDQLAGIVRQNDPRRALSGINASGGVGDAHGQLAGLADAGGFYGDQGLNLTHYFRRFIGQRRYNLPLRHEDIAPVKIGRGVSESNVTERCNWDVFQSAMLGLRHFNFVFTCWTDNEFYQTVFTNSRIKKLIKDSAGLEGDFVRAGLHHSFVSDVAYGNYHYRSISVYRWWLMNALYMAMLENGELFEPFSDTVDLAAMDTMQLMIDDGSPVMATTLVDKLESFVRNGGKLVLTARSGEYLQNQPSPSYALLRRLGYAGSLAERTSGDVELKITDRKLFKNTKTITVNNYSRLSVPAGGRIIAEMPDGGPGAILWTVGKGEVMLLAGNPGSNEEIELMQSISPDGKAHRNTIWQNAEAKLTVVFAPLLRDLTGWVAIKPAYQLSMPCYSALRSGKNGQQLHLFNQFDTPCCLTVKFPDAKMSANVVAVTLSGESTLGAFSAEQLRNGIVLPEIPAKRYLAICLENK